MVEQVDPQEFRRVLGHFPTGVAAVTSLDSSGQPVGMIVGSFTSVSLAPPLVAFLPAKQSGTAPKIIERGQFCVNVLGAHQENVSRSFASGGADKFASLTWTPSDAGMPQLADALAWIECTVDAVHEAGDHDIVVGRVTHLETAVAAPPLLFFQGGYGRFAPMSFAAAGEPDLVEHLRLVDVARPFMEQVANDRGVECLAAAAVDDNIVLLASAGTPADGRSYSRVGQRLPLMPPLSTVLVAWSEPATRAWLARSGEEAGSPRWRNLERMLERVRTRGYAVATWSDKLRELEATVDRVTRQGLTPSAQQAVQHLVKDLDDEHEPERIPADSHLRSVTVPVFDRHDSTVMQLTLRLPPNTGPDELDGHREALQFAAARVTAAIADLIPTPTGRDSASQS